MFFAYKRAILVDSRGPLELDKILLLVCNSFGSPSDYILQDVTVRLLYDVTFVYLVVTLGPQIIMLQLRFFKNTEFLKLIVVYFPATRYILVQTKIQIWRVFD